MFATLRSVCPWADALEVGSTAIEGVLGKGDLDVLVRTDESRFSALLTALDTVFDRNPAQFASPIYQGYVVQSPLDVALQCTVAGGLHDDFEPFLLALRASAPLRAAFNDLKRGFDGHSMDAYRVAKRAFVEDVLSQVRSDC